MISRKYETIVGIFVVASLAALLVMVLIIAEQEQLWQERVAYQAVFKNISGLKKGSEVRLAGFTVGNVAEITVDPKGNLLVTFQVLGKYKDQIRQDTKASIGYMGLLGEKSLDLTTGTPGEPVMSPGGQVASVEPLDITEMVTKAAPSLEKLQKALDNLAAVTEGLADPKSDFSQTMAAVKEIVAKIDQGRGTLGMLVNDPVLYRELAQASGEAGKFIRNLKEGRGFLGTIMNDPTFKAQGEQTMRDLEAVLANFRQVSESLKEAALGLPEMAKKGKSFMEALNRAGMGLPELVVSGQDLVGDAQKVTEAAQKTWLLRRHLPPPQERTIRLDGEAK